MAASRFRRERVRFDRRAVVADDGYGNEINGWAVYAGPVSAEIRPLRGREDALAAKLEERNIVEIIVRYHSAVAGITNADRAVDMRSGQSYNIHTVENRDQQKRYLTFLVETGGVDGGIIDVTAIEATLFDGFTSLDFSESSNSGYLPVIGA